MKDSPIVGVLVTEQLKHLLVTWTRRTACGKVMRSGRVYEGLEHWNSYAPIQCRLCAEEWKERQRKDS